MGDTLFLAHGPEKLGRRRVLQQNMWHAFVVCKWSIINQESAT